MRRWLALGAYAAAIYLTLPYGPAVGRAVTHTALGAWLLGPGMAMLLVAGGLLALASLRRRRAPAYAYALLVLAAAGYGLALAWLRAQRLERVHLPEYGVAAWLAWWAVVPRLPGAAGYVVAAAIAAAIGYGDELLQRIVPGRYYDVRDIAANALAAVLAVLVLAVVRAGRPRFGR